MIRTLFALLLTSAFAPTSVAAAAPGDPPLRTVCNSPTMDFCINFLTWDYRLEFWLQDPSQPPEYRDRYRFRGSGAFELFGSGWASPEWPDPRLEFHLKLYTDPPLCCLIRDVSIRPNGPGIYPESEVTGPFATPIRQPTPYDVHYIVGFPQASHVACWSGPGPSPTPFADACYEPTSVPEPASLLLLATGIGGVGVVARRRRPPIRS